MVWARLDDEILDNSKIAEAGPIGFALHVAGITWCCRNLTDGFIPYARCNALLDLSSLSYDESNPCAVPGGPSSMSGNTGLDPHVVACHLASIGLWDVVEGGYRVHDFLRYNPSKEQVLSRRSGSKKRVQAHRAKPPGNGVSNATVTALHDAKKRVSSLRPDPDPDPDPKRGESHPEDVTALQVTPREPFMSRAVEVYAETVSAITGHDFGFDRLQRQDLASIVAGPHMPKSSMEDALVWLADSLRAFADATKDDTIARGAFKPRKLLEWLNDPKSAVKKSPEGPTTRLASHKPFEGYK